MNAIAFEYLVMNSGLTGKFETAMQSTADMISVAGDDGWELVSVVRVGDALLHYFKRQKSGIIKAGRIAG